MANGNGARKPATCHPDRAVLARGLCVACYAKSRRHQPVGGIIRRYNYMPPITTPEHERDYPVPFREPGVIQHAVTQFPIVACPHCGGPWIEYVGREAHCLGAYGGCGFTTYLVREEVPVSVPALEPVIEHTG